MKYFVTLEEVGSEGELVTYDMTERLNFLPVTGMQITFSNNEITRYVGGIHVTNYNNGSCVDLTIRVFDNYE